MGTIYKCSKSVKFTLPDNSKTAWEMKPGFIGEVPNWVENDWYFKTCCNDGTITALKSSGDNDIQAATDGNKDGAPAETNPESTGEQSPAGETKGAKTDGKKGKG